jgi:hypothetical protein
MTGIVTPELRNDPELMATVKHIEAEAARSGFDLIQFYRAMDAAYRAGCAVARAREAAEAVKPSDL